MRIFLTLLTASVLVAQPQDEPLFLRRIAEFWKEGEYPMAKAQIEEFLQLFPQSTYTSALFAALGDLFLREKHFSQALNAYSQIQSPEINAECLLNRLQCLYELQWHTTLAAECEAFLESAQSPQVSYFLAMSLYAQTLNALQDPEAMEILAKKALPHFEALAFTELKEDAAEEHAHLCALLKDYKQAATLMRTIGFLSEEILFQVALFESEFDKEKALETFSEIIEMNGNKANEANYHRINLAFELAKFETIEDMDQAITTLPLNDPSRPKAFFARAQLLKNQNRFHEAKTQLNDLIANFPQSSVLPQALFELAHLDFKEGNWKGCYEKTNQYLAQFEMSPLAPYARHYLLSASCEIAKENPNSKTQLIQDLLHCLAFEKESSWQILLAKTYFELGQFDEALLAIEDLSDPNAYLIKAFCHQKDQLDLFCEEAELALSLNADLMSKGAIHLALFNSYLELSNIEQAKNHLFAAFQEGEIIQEDNLLWLSHEYLPDAENNPVVANRVVSLLEKIAAPSKSTIYNLAKMYSLLERARDAVFLLESLESMNEEAKLILAKNLIKLGNTPKAKEILHQITTHQKSPALLEQAHMLLTSIDGPTKT